MQQNTIIKKIIKRKIIYGILVIAKMLVPNNYEKHRKKSPTNPKKNTHKSVHFYGSLPKYQLMYKQIIAEKKNDLCVKKIQNIFQI